jgi:hypothetical protein
MHSYVDKKIYSCKKWVLQDPPPINPLVNPKSSPQNASFKFSKLTLDPISSPQLLSKLRMAESSNSDAAIFGLKVKL